MSAARHASATRQQAPRRKITATQVIGELFITISLLLFSFAFYEAYWTNLEAGRQQQDVSRAMEESWNNERVNPRQKQQLALGEAFARMYIPRFGSDFQFAIVEGTNDADLLKGPGRYVDSQMPGEPGNFAVAGHRVGKGAPFNDLGNLQVCDTVVVETRTSWEIYRVLPIAAGDRRQVAAGCFSGAQLDAIATGAYAGVEGRHITLPGDFAVVHPIPGTDTAEPRPDMQSLMTMTTCHPQFSNAERMIVHAMKVRTEPKTDNGRPAELKG